MKEPAFLKMMAEKVRARRILEIGTFDGTSALALAEAIPDDGMVLTCELNAGLAALARKRAGRSPHGRKIDVRVGPALDTLAALTGPFDLIFIDADTANYVRYYERALALLAPAGVILMDNMQGVGLTIAPQGDPAVAAIQELGRRLVSDDRVTVELVPVRDGVMVITPKT